MHKKGIIMTLSTVNYCILYNTDKLFDYLRFLLINHLNLYVQYTHAHAQGSTVVMYSTIIFLYTHFKLHTYRYIIVPYCTNFISGINFNKLPVDRHIEQNQPC
jgi:hypothetical protein